MERARERVQAGMRKSNIFHKVLAILFSSLFILLFYFRYYSFSRWNSFRIPSSSSSSSSRRNHRRGLTSGCVINNNIRVRESNESKDRKMRKNNAGECKNQRLCTWCNAMQFSNADFAYLLLVGMPLLLLLLLLSLVMV